MSVEPKGELNEWSDAELCEALTKAYAPSDIPPCRVCGGALTLQAVGGGMPTEWACSGYEDNPAEPGTVRMRADRKPADDHYMKSEFIDRRRGGDDRVMELIGRFRAVRPAAADVADEFYVLTTKQGGGDHLLWYRPNSAGYTTVLGNAGRYRGEYAKRLHRPGDGLYAIPCALADGVAHRTIAAADLSKILIAMRCCTQFNCPDSVDGDSALCAACIAGEQGLIHERTDTQSCETWCGQAIVERGWTTRKSREHIGSVLNHRGEALPRGCPTCIERARAHMAGRHRAHWESCDFPYCEGCRHGPRCLGDGCEGCTEAP